MKNTSITYLHILIIAISTVASAQDQLITIDGEKISADIKEVRLGEIAYRESRNPSGPLYIIPKQQVYMIQYRNGTKEVFSYSVGEQDVNEHFVNGSLPSSQELYFQGKSDARMHYTKTGTMWGTLGATVLYAPVGLATGILLGIVPPKIEDTVPDYKLLKSPEYRSGYTKKARGKKWGAAATGFGIGVAVNIIVFSLVSN